MTKLSSAIATEQLKTGAVKLARRSFAQSLVNPNDNALAQGVWAEQWLSDLVELPHERFSGEAAVRSSLATSQYGDAINACWVWFEDEPYSINPAANGSFIATALTQDYEAALKFVQRGLIASPNEPILLNNAAVSLSLLGRVAEARVQFSKLKRPDNGRALTIYLATSGLIQFREGKAEEGSRLYREALEKSLQGGHKVLAFRVFTHWIAEEARSGRLGKDDLTLFIRAGDHFVERNLGLSQQYKDVWTLARQAIEHMGIHERPHDFGLFNLLEGVLV